MAKLCAGSNIFIITTDVISIFGKERNDQEAKIIELRPHLQLKPDELMKCADCCELSPSGEHIVVCYDKHLLLFDINSKELLSKAQLSKTASCVRFFKKSFKFLVTDKSGSVSFFSYDKNSIEREKLYLGHNSMITDALVTQCENYVITCDRDEKIRTTNFPHTFNIHMFCLGHTEYVSSMIFLPSDPSVLVSASGDGTIRFWDFANGKELLLFKEEKPFSKVIGLRNNSSSCYLVVMKIDSPDVLVLTINGNRETGLVVNSVKNVKAENTILDIAVIESLVILMVRNNNLLQLCELALNAIIPLKGFNVSTESVHFESQAHSLFKQFRKRVDSDNEHLPVKTSKME